jgi:RND family efflux transporter MFP subunit
VPAPAHHKTATVVFTAPSPVLSSLVASPVRKINRRFGEAFVKGDRLLILDDGFYQANLTAAEAALKAAQVEYQALQSLHQDGNATLMQREQAASEVKQAEKNVVDAREKLEGCVVLAPFNGRVIEVLAQEHELVKIGHPLIKIVNDKTLLAQFLLPEELFPRIRPGLPVRIHVTSFDRYVTGKIKYIAAEVDPASRTFEVRAEVANEAGHLRSGMNAQLDLTALEEQWK